MQNKLIHRDRKQINGHQGLEEGGVGSDRVVGRELPVGHENVLEPDRGDGRTTL